MIVINTLMRCKISQLGYTIYYRVRNIKLFNEIYLQYIKIKSKELYKENHFKNNLFAAYFDDLHKKANDLQIVQSGIRATLTSLKNNTISFLGHAVHFDGTNWSYGKQSILWNYNLHYMHWLNAYMYEDIFNEEKKNKKYVLSALKSWIKAKDKIGNKPYPTSLRLINWALYISYYEIKDYLITRAYVEQYVKLMTSIELNLNGNHLLENYISLFCVSSTLSSESKTEYYKLKLEKELVIQFNKDGLHYERSFAYHFCIIERLILLIYISNGKLKRQIKEILSKSYNILKAICNKDGVPLFQDASHDMYPSIEYLQQSLVKYKRHNVNTIDLNSTNYFLNNDCNIRFIMDYGEPTPSYQPAHSHCSFTSYILDICNVPFIIDTGVHGYYEDNKKRYNSRQTSSHNVLGVKGQEQSEIWSTFRMGKGVRILNYLKKRVNKNGSMYCVKYVAFPSINNIICKRTVYLSTNPFRLFVVDVVEKEFAALLTNIVLDPDVIILENLRLKLKGNKDIYMLSTKNKVHIEKQNIYKIMGVTQVSKKMVIYNETPSCNLSYLIKKENDNLAYQIMDDCNNNPTKVCFNDGFSLKLIW